MPSQTTRQQISKISINNDRGLLICDVDEVIVHFIAGLETFLNEIDLWLDASSFALNGNIKKIKDNQPVPTERVREILEQFFVQRTKSLEPIEGAVENLKLLSEQIDVVLLSNLPHFAYHDRLKNMSELGLSFPLITNEGGKGPAAALMTASHTHDLFFIDDIPQYLSSVAEHCPQTQLIHFSHDQRFAKHAPKLAQPHFKTDSWPSIKDHILKQLEDSTL